MSENGCTAAGEYEELRSSRFERKGLSFKNRKNSEEAVLCYRGDEMSFGEGDALLLEDIRPLSDDPEAFAHNFETDADVLQWLCSLAGHSPSARLLLKEAQGEGWGVRLDDLSQEGYAIDEAEQVILLDHFGLTANALGRSSHFRNTLLVQFVKALRELWHDREGHSFETTHRTEAVLLLERVRAADCETMAILAGWELRGAGYSDLWRLILGSEEGDMAMVFTRAMEKDPSGFYDGSVLTRAFCQWYGDEMRVAAADHATLERMDAMLEKAQGEEIFGTSSLKAADVEKMSRLPGGRAYLKGMGANIATDPYFVSVNDPINESHLFQVVYDSKVIMVEGVPFRDQRLARLIFPGGLVKIGG